MGLTPWVCEREADERELFLHLSRVTSVPPLVAQAAFDGMRLARCWPGRPNRWDVLVPGGRLEFHGDGRVAPPPKPCYWSSREVPGVIRSRWWRVTPVRLDLVPSSDACTALALTAQGPSSGVSGGMYQRIGSAALDLLAGDIDAWPFRDLRDVQTSSRGFHPPQAREWN